MALILCGERANFLCLSASCGQVVIRTNEGSDMAEREIGVFSFLFTDIESSTALWGHHPAAMRDALRRHNIIIREALESNSSPVSKTIRHAITSSR